MNGLIIFVVIVLISAAIGAVSQVLKNQQQAEQARAARARARARNQRNERDDDERDERDEDDGRRRDAPGARNQPSEIDRFLEEIERLRKKGGGGPPVAKPAQPRPAPVPPPPVVRPARPVPPPPAPVAKASRPADDRSFPEAKQKRQTNAQATEARRRAETQAERPVPTSRKSQDLPPMQNVPIGPILPSSAGSTDPVTKGSLVGSEFAASASEAQPTDFTRSVVDMLKESDSLAKAFLLTEILGKPKSTRR